MTRRDRTTGLPKHRPRPVSKRERRVAGIPVRDWYSRVAILGGVALLFLFVLGLVGYRWYDENIGKPREVVLTVEGETFSLRYFTDRLGSFALSNPQLGRGFIEPSLLTKLEEEAVTVRMAQEAGIDLSDEAVTQHIADELGVEPGGSGTTFDSLYRQRLRETGLRERDYRRLSRASLAEAALLEQILDAIGGTGEVAELRTVVTSSEDNAHSIVERIGDGEDMAEIARTESEDLASREEGGMMQEMPLQLLPEELRDAIAEAGEGDLVGPVQVQDHWWIVRAESIDPDGTLSDEHREQIAEQELEERISEARQAADIERSLRDSHVSWAYRNVTIPGVN